MKICSSVPVMAFFTALLSSLGEPVQAARRIGPTRRQLKAITHEGTEGHLAELRGEHARSSIRIIDSKAEGEKARRVEEKGVWLTCPTVLPIIPAPAKSIQGVHRIKHDRRDL
jgi:hypothetical protein